MGYNTPKFGLYFTTIFILRCIIVRFNVYFLVAEDSYKGEEE